MWWHFLHRVYLLSKWEYLRRDQFVLLPVHASNSCECYHHRAIRTRHNSSRLQLQLGPLPLALVHLLPTHQAIQRLRFFPVLQLPRNLIQRPTPAHVDHGLSWITFAALTTVSRIMNPSPARAAVPAAAAVLIPPCASPGQCVCFLLPSVNMADITTGGEQHTVTSNENWHYSVSTYIMPQIHSDRYSAQRTLV
jgi:hypothetical protein